MAVSDKEIRRYISLGIIFLMVVLSTIVVWKIYLPIFAGLILAYLLTPLYRQTQKVLKERNISALAVSAIIILLIFIPIWFLLPLSIQQLISTFNYVQGVDIAGFVDKIIPGAAQQTKIDLTTSIIGFIGNMTSGILSSFTKFLIDLPTVLLNLSVFIFVFFYALRDGEKLKNYFSDLSPFRKDKERILSKKFKDTTYSIIYGYIVIGVLQGIATGIGLFVAGVPKPLVLTLFAIIASIIPVVGPWLVWIPASIYLFTEGSMVAAIGFTLYSVLFVSTIDNLLRPYIVARRTKSSSVIVLIGMIGGLLTFGILGIILGPLILAYLILFLDAYRDKTLADLFSSD